MKNRAAAAVQTAEGNDPSQRSLAADRDTRRTHPSRLLRVLAKTTIPDVTLSRRFTGCRYTAEKQRAKKAVLLSSEEKASAEVCCGALERVAAAYRFRPRSETSSDGSRAPAVCTVPGGGLCRGARFKVFLNAFPHGLRRAWQLETHGMPGGLLTQRMRSSSKTTGTGSAGTAN